METCNTCCSIRQISFILLILPPLPSLSSHLSLSSFSQSCFTNLSLLYFEYILRDHLLFHLRVFEGVCRCSLLDRNRVALPAPSHSVQKWVLVWASPLTLMDLFGLQIERNTQHTHTTNKQKIGLFDEVPIYEYTISSNFSSCQSFATLFAFHIKTMKYINLVKCQWQHTHTHAMHLLVWLVNIKLGLSFRCVV